MQEGCAPQRAAVRQRRRPLGGVENQLNVAVFDGVDDMGPALRHLVDLDRVDSLGGEVALRARGRQNLKSQSGEQPGRLQDATRLLAGLGFKILATSGTQRYLAAQGVDAVKINKVAEGRPHIVDAIKNGDVQLVFNTTEGATALADSRSLRRAALLHKVPYYTTLSGAVAAAQGIKAYLGGDLEVCALQSYFGAEAESDQESGRPQRRYV